MLFDWTPLPSIMWFFLRVTLTAVWSYNLETKSDFSFRGDNHDFPKLEEQFTSSFWSQNLKHTAAPYATVKASVKICNFFGLSLQNPCHLEFRSYWTLLHLLSRVTIRFLIFQVLVCPSLISTERNLEWWAWSK